MLLDCVPCELLKLFAQKLAVIKSDDAALEDFAHLIIEDRYFNPGKALCEASSIDVDRALEDIAQFWRNGDPVAMDIVIRARAGDGLSTSPTSCGRGSSAPTEMIIETWRMELATKPATLEHKPDFLAGPVDASATVMPASKLLTLALKSFLHFSPVNSWLLKDPSARSRLTYRVHAPYSTCSLERTRQFTPLELEQSQLLLEVNYQQTCPGAPWFSPSSQSNGASAAATAVVVSEVVDGASSCVSRIKARERAAARQSTRLCPSSTSTPTESPPSAPSCMETVRLSSSACRTNESQCTGQLSGKGGNHSSGLRLHVGDHHMRVPRRSACGGDISPVGAACGGGKRDRPYYSQHFRRPSPKMRGDAHADDASITTDQERDSGDECRDVHRSSSESSPTHVPSFTPTAASAPPVFLTPKPIYSSKRANTHPRPEPFMTPPMSTLNARGGSGWTVKEDGGRIGAQHDLLPATPTVATVNESKQVGASGYFSSPPRTHATVCLSPDPRKKFGHQGVTGSGGGGRRCSAPIPIGAHPRVVGPRSHARGTPSSLGRSASLSGSGASGGGTSSGHGSSSSGSRAWPMASPQWHSASGGSDAVQLARYREATALVPSGGIGGVRSPVVGFDTGMHSGGGSGSFTSRQGMSWESGGLMAGRNFLGSYEESLLSGRMSHSAASPVAGFVAELGACGAGRTPAHITLPLPASFYKIPGEDTPSPYVGHVQLDAHPNVLPAGRYRIPVQGLVQLMVYNPERTGTKVFLVKYDLRDMPAKTHTFLRQRTFVEHALRSSPTGATRTTTRLLYAIHLRFVCTKPGRVYLHKDIRVVFSHRAPDKTEKVKTITEGPKNPSYSPLKKSTAHPKKFRAASATPNDYSGVATESHDRVKHRNYRNLKHMHGDGPPPRLSLEA